jgi:tRNA 2-thiouridine synthesizing protein A
MQGGVTPTRSHNGGKSGLDWDLTLDCEGLLCPLPVLRARKRLLAMRVGEVLCVRTTDKMALIDLPHYCAEAGHTYIEAREDGVVTLHLIRRA